MLFLQFMLYSSSFVGTLVKNEIPEAALELCQLNINQVSPDILKFRTKHEDNQDNSFTLNCFVVSCSFLFIFHAGLRGLGSNNSRNSSYKEKADGSVRVSRLSFRFLWPCCHLPMQSSVWVFDVTHRPNSFYSFQSYYQVVMYLVNSLAIIVVININNIFELTYYKYYK